MLHMTSKEREITAVQPRVAVAVSTYNAWITRELLAGARNEYLRRTGSEKGLLVFPAAGAFELTAICRSLAESGKFDAVVALGCVIRGETEHFDYICDSVTHGLTEITLRTGIPIGFGLLTCNNAEQAESRAGGEKGNKGTEAMSAALQTVATLHTINDLVTNEPGTSSKNPRSNIDLTQQDDNQQENPGNEPVSRPPVTSLVPEAEGQSSPAEKSTGLRTKAEPRQVRQLALVVLYELDARGEMDAEQISRDMPLAILMLLKRDDNDEDLPRKKGPAPSDMEICRSFGFEENDLKVAYNLGMGAFRKREEADQMMLGLAPDWPPDRQPALDRCILRLAYYEMTENITPPKVVINEAVELAKRFSTENSAMFVNGVLDKMMRRLRSDNETTDGE